MSDVIIRRATAADRDTIGELWWEMMMFHRECDPRYFRLKPKAEALVGWSTHLDECMADDKQIVLVADAGSELAGFGMGRLGGDPPCFDLPIHGFVTNFFVSDKWRRKGVGRLLFDALAAEFAQREITEVRLSVSAFNPVSNAFWREMGFEPYTVMMRRTV